MRIAFFLMLLLSFSSHSVELTRSFFVDRMPLNETIRLAQEDVFGRPYLLTPELSNDARLVSLDLTLKDPKATVKQQRLAYISWLRRMNIAVETKDGVDHYRTIVIKAVPPKIQTYVYTPLNRPPSYISKVLSSKLPSSSSSGGTSGETGAAQPVDSKSFISGEGDSVVFHGTSSELARIKTLLPLIDVPAQGVLVTGYIYEVQSTEAEGSGLSLVAKLLSSKLGISIGSQLGGDYISFNSTSLNAMYELFRKDSRFKVVSAPRLRMDSDKEASFSVGAQVPVLGSVSYEDGKPVKSVQYRDSGVIFKVKPVVTGSRINLSVNQQLSNFVKTDTGVNDTPTLIKREVDTSLTVKDGDIVLLSGLAENKDSTANTGLSFLPSIFSQKSGDQTKTDLIILLQVKKVK